MGTSLCDVTMTLKRQEKIGNIFFLKENTFFYKKMYVTLLPKNFHGITQRPTLIHVLFEYGFELENTYNEPCAICMTLYTESVADQTDNFADGFVCKNFAYVL